MKRTRDIGDDTPSMSVKTNQRELGLPHTAISAQSSTEVDDSKLRDDEYVVELQPAIYVEDPGSRLFPSGLEGAHARVYEHYLAEEFTHEYSEDLANNIIRAIREPCFSRPGFEDNYKTALIFGIMGLSDVWKYPRDDTFAAVFAEEVENSGSDSSAMRLCGQCSTIESDGVFIKFDPRKAAKSCLLCKLLAPYSAETNKSRKIALSRLHPTRRVCAARESPPLQWMFQIGFPTLPNSTIRSKLFRQWLQLCDREHRNIGCPLENAPLLPTRVIDVSDNVLRLHIAKPGDRGQYIALSHCWGNLPEKQKRRFCTTSHNVDDRSHSRNFGMDMLPKTFQDAIKVTKDLGQRYIWIDSLCIIQYGDNLEDWKTESKQMASVFSNAYCTIAATSAENSSKGFLDRKTPEQPDPQYVKVQTPEHGSLYISEVVDDYHKDVELGVLNQRAWVLQERALSRRTIHFTDNQTYWECGDGVRCETLTYMRNSKALFLSDPTFPALLMYRQPQDRIQLFQDLFSRYSQLGLTKASDRPIAVAGLVDRLAETFSMKATYGVFDGYLHRSLVWHRSETQEMQRIHFGTEWNVPSWSWMAYSGQITYVDIPCYEVEWSQSIRLNDGVLEAQVRSLQLYGISIEGDEIYLKQRLRKRKKGWVRFDACNLVEMQTLRCVIVGRDQKPVDQQFYYVIFVVPERLGKDRTFERVGVGSIPAAFISFEDEAVPARII